MPPNPPASSLEARTLTEEECDALEDAVMVDSGTCNCSYWCPNRRNASIRAAFSAGFAEGARGQRKRGEPANRRCVCSGCGDAHEYQAGESGVAAIETAGEGE